MGAQCCGIDFWQDLQPTEHVQFRRPPLEGIQYSPILVVSREFALPRAAGGIHQRSIY